MPRTKKSSEDMTTTITPEHVEENLTESSVEMGDIGWTDFVLSKLTDDEKISGNPTTDGLRRIFENILDCTIISNISKVIQSPSPDNEKRATVVCTLEFILNNQSVHQDIKKRTVTGAADVYWGNCDKIYRNHPVAVAETRAEGRALRRALKLRKVVAAEEIVQNPEDDPDKDSVNKISSNQINFIDVLCKRLNINALSLFKSLDISQNVVYNISHDEAVKSIRELSRLQQDISLIPENLHGYDNNWK
jgi:hypothetical protein